MKTIKCLKREKLPHVHREALLFAVDAARKQVDAYGIGVNSAAGCVSGAGQGDGVVCVKPYSQHVT